MRDYKTRTWHRASKLIPFGAGGLTGPEIVKHDDAALHVIPTYTREPAGRRKLKSLTTNQADLVKQADHYLAGAALAYQTPSPREVSYIGLRPISPDGAIQQVTWSVGPQGTTTRAGRNDEFSSTVLPYAERRLMEKLRDDALADVKRKALTKRQEARNVLPS